MREKRTAKGENDEERLVHECCRVVIAGGDDGKMRY